MTAWAKQGEPPPNYYEFYDAYTAKAKAASFEEREKMPRQDDAFAAESEKWMQRNGRHGGSQTDPEKPIW